MVVSSTTRCFTRWPDATAGELHTMLNMLTRMGEAPASERSTLDGHHYTCKVVVDHDVKMAVGETGILLHPPLPLVGALTAVERGCQSNNSLADG